MKCNCWICLIVDWRHTLWCIFIKYLYFHQKLERCCSAGPNPKLQKYQLEDVVTTSTMFCRCLSHMALSLKMCSWFDTSVHQLFPLDTSSHQLCRALETWTWLGADRLALCHSSMVWWHGSPTHRWSRLIRPGSIWISKKKKEVNGCQWYSLVFLCNL